MYIFTYIVPCLYDNNNTKYCKYCMHGYIILSLCYTHVHIVSRLIKGIDHAEEKVWQFCEEEMKHEETAEKDSNCSEL